MIRIFEKKTSYNVVFAIVLSAIFECLLGLLRGYNSVLSGIVFLILYSGFILYIGTHSKRLALYTVVLVVTFLAIQVPVRILWWNDSLGSLPEGCMHLIGILCGLILLKCGRAAKVVTVMVMVVLCLTFNKICIHWEQYISYGNMDGIVTEQIQGSPEIEDADGTAVRLNDMKGSYIVIDCCSTRCGVCIRDLPEVQRLYDKYRDRDKIKLFVLFFKLKGESNKEIHQWLSEKGDYSFPVLYGDLKELSPCFKAFKFPTIIVIDPSGKIVFRGCYLEMVESYLKKIEKKGYTPQ